jgi:hypothetical protein
MSKENKIFAGITFLLSFIVYFITMAPTVSFWDCGEFSACSYIMGVPHPPGTPLFQLIGRVFTLIPWKDVAFRTNLISVFSTAFTISILFLIIVRFIQEWRGQAKTFEEKVIVNAGGFIGAMSFAFTDTLWFNAVETEVYAMSIFLTALTFWLFLMWMDNYTDYKSVRFLLLVLYLFGLGAGVHLLNLLVIPSILLLIIFTEKKLLLRYDLWGALPILIIIGYSTYLMIIIRAGLHPAINENNPDNWENFVKYLKREQYGTESQFTTFFHRVAPFWAYQVKKMFLRYFGWQFIGKGTTIGTDGYIAENLSFRGLYGLPFILGIAGMVHHFYKDWKRALSILIFFIMTGIALVVYLNQPDPQPRERDYVYVGCFLAFAIWIGIGMVGILEGIITKLKENVNLKWIAVSAVILIIIFIIPVNMLRFNFDEHDRTGNYVPWDYSYNILQACEPNAILITNGDNDTFPLWYLQEVEGIRKDVRIANLSLLNTNWYILQLKNEEPKVPISLSDEFIQRIGLVPWKKQNYRVEVPPRLVSEYMADVKGEMNVPETPAVMEFEVNPTWGSQGLKTQDYMVLNIMYANQWKKPIYFALTVSDGGKVGLNDYLRMDGMSMKLIPFKGIKISPSLLEKNLFEKYKFRKLNDPDVYYDYQTTELLQNYRTLFTHLALHYYNKGEREKVVKVLDKIEEVMPSSVIPINREDVDMIIGRMYADCGRPQELEKRLDKYSAKENVNHEKLFEYAVFYKTILNNNTKSINTLKKVINIKRDFVNAYSFLMSIYDQEKLYKEEIELIEQWLIVNPNDAGARKKLEGLRGLLLTKGDSIKVIK